MEGTIDFIIPDYVSCVDVKDVKDINCHNVNNQLSVLHVNIRSLKNRDHFLELTTFLQLFNFKFNVIVVTETWVNDPAEYMFLNLYSRL